MTEVRLSDQQLNSIIAKAILDSMTPERRDELIGKAVTGLLELKANPNRYDSRSRLQEAFDDAVLQVARKVAEEKVSNNSEMRDRIDKLYADAWKKMVEGDGYEKLVEKIAGAFSQALTGSRY